MVTTMWQKIMTTILFLNILFGLNCCVSANKIWSDEDKYLDYGKTKKWMPMFLRNKLTDEIKSTTNNDVTKPSSSLSPAQALEVAKMMVLPLNDKARQQVMNTYGTNKEGMDKMLQEWMRANTNTSFLRPIQAPILNIREEDFGLNKLLPTHTVSPQADSMARQINKMAANFWNNTHPENIDLSVLRQNTESPRLNLPGASFWEVGNPAAQPPVPYATTGKYDLLTREIPGNKPEDPGDLWLASSPLSQPTKQVPHAAVEKVIQQDNDNADIRMYDYKSPSWDEMPTLYMLQTTTASAEIIITAPTTLFPHANDTHPAVLHAREMMFKHNMKYLSTFLSTFCEIMTIHKKGRYSKLLAIGLMLAVDDLIQQGRLLNLGTETIKKIEHAADKLSEFSHEQLEVLLDTVHYVFQNHSYFANDSREVIAEIESWYSMHEGEALFNTLISVDEFPSQGKNQKKVMEEVLRAVLAPYNRLGPGSKRREELLFKLELLMTRVHRRYFDINMVKSTPTMKMKEYFNNLRKKDTIEKKNTAKTSPEKKHGRNIPHIINFSNQNPVVRAKHPKDSQDDELEIAQRLVQMDRENFNSIGRPIKVIETHDADRKNTFDVVKNKERKKEQNSKRHKKEEDDLFFDIKNKLHKITTEKKHSTSRTTKIYKQKETNRSFEKERKRKFGKNKSHGMYHKIHEAQKNSSYRSRNKNKSDKKKTKKNKTINSSNEAKDRINKDINKSHSSEILASAKAKSGYYSEKKPSDKQVTELWHRKVIRQGLKRDSSPERLGFKNIVANYADKMKGNDNFSDNSAENNQFLLKERAKGNKKSHAKHNETIAKSSSESERFEREDVSKGITKFFQYTRTEKEKQSLRSQKHHNDKQNSDGHKKGKNNEKNKTKYDYKITRLKRVYYPKRYTVKTRPIKKEWEIKSTGTNKKAAKNERKKKKTFKIEVKSHYFTGPPVNDKKSEYVVHTNKDNEENEILKYVYLPQNGAIPKENLDTNRLKSKYNLSSDDESPQTSIETRHVSYEKIDKKFKTVTTLSSHKNLKETEESKRDEDRRNFNDQQSTPKEEEEDIISEENIKSKYVNAHLHSKETKNVEKKMHNRFKDNFLKGKPASLTNFDKIGTHSVENKGNYALKHIIEGSSYSDDENNIKTNLNDALRHENLVNITNVARRNILVKKEKTVRDLTSGSDEEGVLKNNIYKVFGSQFLINKYHND